MDRGADCRCARSAPARPDAVPGSAKFNSADPTRSFGAPSSTRPTRRGPRVGRAPARARGAHGDHVHSAERISALRDAHRPVPIGLEDELRGAPARSRLPETALRSAEFVDRGADCRCARSAPGRPDAVPALGVPPPNPDAHTGTVCARPRESRRSVMRIAQSGLASKTNSAEPRCVRDSPKPPFGAPSSWIEAQTVAALGPRRADPTRSFGAPSSWIKAQTVAALGPRRADPTRSFGAPSSTRPTRRGPRVGRPAAEPGCAHGDRVRSAERISALRDAHRPVRISLEDELSGAPLRSRLPETALRSAKLVDRGADCRCARSAPARPDAVPGSAKFELRRPNAVLRSAEFVDQGADCRCARSAPGRPDAVLRSAEFHSADPTRSPRWASRR